MGNIEGRVRKRRHRQNIQLAVLTSLKVAGVLALGMLAPNTLQLLRFLPKDKSIYADRTRRSIENLLKKRLVKISSAGGSSQVELTPKGEAFLARLAIGGGLKKPRRWDKKWRVIIFDIPERRRTTRDQLRLTLVQIGFKKLQDSVWVYPYDCEDVIQLIKTDVFLSREVVYIVAEEVEYSQNLKKFFNLEV